MATCGICTVNVFAPCSVNGSTAAKPGRSLSVQLLPPSKSPKNVSRRPSTRTLRLVGAELNSIKSRKLFVSDSGIGFENST